jgi:transposase
VAKRLRPYFDTVIAGFMHGIKLGLVEAINGKIARLRAAAHGFSNREYFKLKIFQRCSLPHNPWARIVL